MFRWFFIVGIVTFACACASNPSAPEGPNLILISLDTVRADHTTPYGYTRDTTPHLNRLAQEGIVYEQGARHRQQKRLCIPAFEQKGSMTSFLTAVQEETDVLARRWAEARDALSTAYQISMQRHGPEHRDTLRIADVLKSLERYAKPRQVAA